MGTNKISRETKKALKDAKHLIEEVSKADGNEAETRRRVERIFESLMGYDVFKHITRELAVRGAGETEHCDFAIRLDDAPEAKPVVMVELKRVNIDLASKHLKQISSYAINAGCEWILLTNGKDWRLYHVSFGQPPQTKLMESWNILDDEPIDLARKFELISYRSLKKGALEKLWALATRNVLGVLLSESSLRLVRRELKKSSGVSVSPEEIVGAVRRILNEAALTEMDSMKISLPERKKRRRKSKLNGESVQTPSLEVSTGPDSPPHLNTEEVQIEAEHKDLPQDQLE